jgi:hypothetical protein
MKRKAKAAPTRVYRLRLELQDLEPLIWRELDVRPDMSLSDLHRAIQIVMGWEDYRLWAFQAGEQRFERPGEELGGLGEPAQDAAATSIEMVLPEEGSHLVYTYDFGDDWMVTISVVNIGLSESGVRYPRCIAGERAGPLEDSGGAPGYEALIAAHKKPGSPEAKELLEWAGEGWDPHVFDLDAINQALTRLRASRRRS